MKNRNNARVQSNSFDRTKGKVRSKYPRCLPALVSLIVRPITKSLEKALNQIIKKIQSVEDSIEIIAREIETQKKRKGNP